MARFKIDVKRSADDFHSKKARKYHKKNSVFSKKFSPNVAWVVLLQQLK